MKNKVIVNGIDVFKDIDYKESLIKDLKDIVSKQQKLLELYKEFFDKLNIELRNTFDIDYIYPHEFIIGNGIKSEDKELVKLFKQIKEEE